MKSFLASTIVAIAFAQDEEAAEPAAPARNADWEASYTAYAGAADDCAALVEGIIGEAPRRATEEYTANLDSETPLCECYSTANALDGEDAVAAAVAACSCDQGDETQCVSGAAAIATGAALFAIAALLQ